MEDSDMNKKILPIIAAAAVAAAVLTVVFVPKSGNQAQDKNPDTLAENTVRTVAKSTAEPASEDAAEVSVSVDGDIEIKINELNTDSASVLNYNLDGTEIGLLAIKDDDENIYAAFNTCQVCNGSPRAYFVQKNGRLVCQNCGNQFALSSIASSAMGCNPITISDDYITKTDEGIIISKEFLEANKDLFSNWKKL